MNLDQPDPTTKVKTKPCPHCHKSSFIDIRTEDYERWQGGELIQNVWPEMTPDERELLMTGIHPGCWNEMFDDAGEAAVRLLQAVFKEES